MQTTRVILIAGIVLGGGLLLAAETRADARCERQAELRLTAPGARALAEVYPRGCTVGLVSPHVTLRFRNQADAPPNVFAERMRLGRVQWRDAHRLVIEYQSQGEGAVREQLIRSGSDSVRVILTGIRRTR